MEEGKTYFTDITEDEKRIINLMRAYIEPAMHTQDFVDDTIDLVMNSLVTKTIKLLAFTEVSNDPKIREWSTVKQIAIMNTFEDYIRHDKAKMDHYTSIICADVVDKLEGGIIPLKDSSWQIKAETEQKTLDNLAQQ